MNISSQTKEISKENYYQSYREASKKRLETSRREIIQKKDFKDGKLLFTTEIVDEYLKPDKQHYVSSQIFDDHTEKREFILIDKIYYCRKNDTDWVQSSKWCGFGSGSGGPSSIVSTKFTVEEAKLNNQKAEFYQKQTIYKNIYSPDKDNEGLSYWQTSFWLGKDGFILREEVKVGLSKPERIYWQTATTYEYNPKNLKIEAPIK